MSNFIDGFIEQRGLDTTRKLIHRNGFRAVLATAFIREGAAEIVRLLGFDRSLDPTRVADPATEQRVLSQLDVSWIASRTGTEPHVARDALRVVVPDILLALEELYRNSGSLQSAMPSAKTPEKSPAPPLAFGWTLDLVVV